MDVMIVEAGEQCPAVCIETLFAILGSESTGDFENSSRIDANILDAAFELRILDQQDPVQSAIRFAFGMASRGAVPRTLRARGRSIFSRWCPTVT